MEGWKVGVMKYVDMHCDTVSRLYEGRKTGMGEGLRVNAGHVDLRKMEKGGALLQNFALFVDMGKGEDPLEEVLGMADLYYTELEANADVIAPVFCFADIERNRKAGKMSALLTVEEGGVCKGKLAYLRNLYRLGVRMMTLTWNYANEIGYPARNADSGRKKDGKRSGGCVTEAGSGLTDRGREFVEEMERLGMIVDVSHLSDAGFYDVLEVAKKPFVASHSNARAVCAGRRNLTDDMIKKLAERGGVIGLNFYPDFLTEVSEGTANPGTIAAITEHARHIIHVGGIDCLGLGSDFDGIDGHAQLPDCSYMPLLERALRQCGWSESEVEKIFCRNVLRVYEEVLKGTCQARAAQSGTENG